MFSGFHETNHITCFKELPIQGRTIFPPHCWLQGDLLVASGDLSPILGLRFVAGVLLM